jgi:hypothetical protein
MNKRHTVVIFALLTLVASGAWAQTSDSPGGLDPSSGPRSPEETEIIVPELVLRVPELELQQVSAVLPEEGELALGQVNIPLPGAQELDVDEEAFSIPLPGTAPQPEGTSVFSSGRLGAGTMNHVVGELSLFKLGADPRFRLRFSHEGLDGYQFLDAGTGYFSNSNTIDGWFSARTEQLSSEVEASFSEEVDGLQGRSDFFSAGVRRTTGSADLTFTPDPLVELNGNLDASVTSRIQSTSGSSAVPREQEFSVTPAAEGRVAVGAVDIVLSTSYFLRFLAGGELPVQQDVDLLAGVDVELPASWSATARAGILWEPGSALSYPWSLTLSALFGEALETTLSGGYRVERLTLGEIWADVPLAAVGDAEADADLVNDGQWYGSFGARWSGPSGLTVTAGADFVAHETVVDIREYDPVADEFPFIQRPVLTLATSARASWRPESRIQVQAGWNGVFLDSVTGTPTGSVDGSVRVSDASERFTAAAEARADFYPEVSMPWTALSGSFAPSEELEFTLEFTDLLAPLLEQGRPTIGPEVSPGFPFIEPGFRASLFTRISL